MEVKEDYVSFEVAKLLKEKGFRERTNRYYNAQYNEARTVSDVFFMDWNDDELMKRISMKGAFSIPTHQLACAWLRKNYNLHVCPKLACFRGAKKHDKEYYKWEDRVLRLPTNNQVHPQLMGIHEYYNTYEEAVEAALKYSLENLI